MKEKITRRDIIRKISFQGLAGILLLSSCKQDKIKEIKETEEKSFKVSEDDYFQYGANRQFIRYAGMPNKESFSISEMGRDSINIYYPADSKRITFKGRAYEVMSVDTNQITLKPLRN